MSHYDKQREEQAEREWKYGQKITIYDKSVNIIEDIKNEIASIKSEINLIKNILANWGPKNEDN